MYGGRDDLYSIALHWRYPGVVVAAALGYVIDDTFSVAQSRVGEVV